MTLKSFLTDYDGKNSNYRTNYYSYKKCSKYALPSQKNSRRKHQLYISSAEAAFYNYGNEQ